ncbi:ATP-dependent 6-phosphofructokinase [Desertibaculum subflavum]|uniref:ATP-dependent 6-phosphofructokinase n=1 Tax=Desertibaculum subflavum TaxID=2268458 RepID=UPI000E664B21
MRVGILTSGGDCAGLNAIIRAAVLRAGSLGWTVVGIRQGTLGLLRDPPDAEELGPGVTASDMLLKGGTVLGTTNHGDPFAFPMPDGSKRNRSAEVAAGVRKLGLGAVIGIGGDGSFAILRRLAQEGGFNLVGIPKTIDNDVGLTETAIGYATAVATAAEALDRLQPTAASHSRVMVLEVMGRDAGHIAIAAGIAGGADVVLIPEIPWTVASVAQKVEALRQAGRNFALVVVAEAVPTEQGAPVMVEHLGGQKRLGGVGHYVGTRLAEATGAEVRVTVLGHVQRGGTPIAADRLLGSVFGVHAVDLVAEGKFDRMVAWWNREVIDVPFDLVLDRPKLVDPQGPMVRTARGLGICLGD